MVKTKYLTELPWKDSYIDLASHLTVEVEADFRSCAIWCEDLELGAQALDEDEALQEFALELETIVDSLVSVPKSSLNSDQLRLLEKLEYYLPLEEEYYE